MAPNHIITTATVHHQPCPTCVTMMARCTPSLRMRSASVLMVFTPTCRAKGRGSAGRGWGHEMARASKGHSMLAGCYCRSIRPSQHRCPPAALTLTSSGKNTKICSVGSSCSREAAAAAAKRQVSMPAQWQSAPSKAPAAGVGCAAHCSTGVGPARPTAPAQQHSTHHFGGHDCEVVTPHISR